VVERPTLLRKAFVIFAYAFLFVVSLTCIIPFLHAIAVSFSSREAAVAGAVGISPININLESYTKLLAQPYIFQSLFITVQRVLLGVTLNTVMVVLTAYPLSQEKEQLRFRAFYAWFFVLTMLISGGLIPWYLTVRQFNLLNTVWALIIPGAVPVFSVVLMLNFFRQLPRELEEAALIDGASHLRVMAQIYLPLSKAGLATVVLFAFVNHWNSWFDGLILMNDTAKYPLQSLMQTFVIQSGNQFFSAKDLQALKYTSEVSMKSALVVIGAVPVLVVFPFFQKFLVKGIVLGSVKQ
jgi:putative aldouronate transport system permease protein